MNQNKQEIKTEAIEGKNNGIRISAGEGQKRLENGGEQCGGHINGACLCVQSLMGLAQTKVLPT